MKFQQTALLFAGALVSAGPLPGNSNSMQPREVPQEHSHDFVLDLVRTSLAVNNPKKIQDPVFGLLGNAAAKAGAGAVTNTDCLQQETADQAFTNAKAAGDIPGMAGALLYRSIERNTGSVGLASVICTETAVNAEIAALTQHQDPASANAASVNKGIALELAKQLALVGADPLLALEAGTFAPGNLGDNTGKGNTCDTVDDLPGCIFTQNLLVLDATPDEISSAVAGLTPTITGTGVLSATHVNFAGLSVAGGTVLATVTATDAADAQITDVSDVCTASFVTVTETATIADAATASDAECTQSFVTVTETLGAAPAAETASCSLITTTILAGGATTLATQQAATPTQATGTGADSSNVQAFTGTLGGPAPPITSTAGSARPFTVNGNTFVNIGAAIQRSCDIQHNACANAANSGKLSGGIAQCETQQAACSAANSNSKRQVALDFGACSNPTISFKSGLDGRTQNAFIADNQADFNHGSALNIAVIAGFICQRLDSSCKAGAAAQAACSSASAAAVATQQAQVAADVFNSIIGGGGAAQAVQTTAAAVVQATQTASAVVMTITQCA